MKLRFMALCLSACLAFGCDDDDGDSTDSNITTKDGGNTGRRDGGGDVDEMDARLPDGRVPERDARTSDEPEPQGDGATAVVDDRDDGCPADAPIAVNRVRFYPVDGAGEKLVGARFEGSNQSTTGGFVELTAITEAVEDGAFSELRFENDVVYRYVRFFDPEGRVAPLAEVEFYHNDTKLTGKTYGTVGSDAHPVPNAFDGMTDTHYQGMTAGGNYLGLDIAGSYVAATPTFTPPGGVLSGPTNVELASATPGAEIHYTTDGSTPSAQSPRYEAPIPAGTGRINIRAIATAPCHVRSEEGSASYGTAGMPVMQGQSSYHLGNSLTDSINMFMKPVVDSTGVTHRYARWTMSGTEIEWQSQHPNEGSWNPEGANQVSSFVQSFAPIDHMSVQPFTDVAIEKHGNAALTWLQPAVAASPNMQAWIFAQWPSALPHKGEGMNPGYLDDGFARGSSFPEWGPPPTPVPETWEATADAQLRFHEAFRDYVDERLDGKPVLIVPGGSALAELKRRVDAGTFPGLTDFLAQVFPMDDLHVSPLGHYLVTLVFYSCMYRQDPTGVVTFKPDEVTEEQATQLKQIAWKVASEYPGSGIAAP